MIKHIRYEKSPDKVYLYTIAKHGRYWYPADGYDRPDRESPAIHPVKIAGETRWLTSTATGGGLGTVWHEYGHYKGPWREGGSWRYLPEVYAYSMKDLIEELSK